MAERIGVRERFVADVERNLARRAQDRIRVRIIEGEVERRQPAIDVGRGEVEQVIVVPQR